jgi:hypothetical protein
MMKGRHHQELIEKTRGLAPIRTVVVHPVDTVSLLGAIEAAKENSSSAYWSGLRQNPSRSGTGQARPFRL